jgi:hypothetical protein
MADRKWQHLVIRFEDGHVSFVSIGLLQLAMAAMVVPVVGTVGNLLLASQSEAKRRGACLLLKLEPVDIQNVPQVRFRYALFLRGSSAAYCHVPRAIVGNLKWQCVRVLSLSLPRISTCSAGPASFFPQRIWSLDGHQPTRHLEETVCIAWYSRPAETRENLAKSRTSL